MSKLSFSESEYFLAIMVRGQNILNTKRTIPSPTISPMPIQVCILTLLKIPEYRI
jgi:hypothetical protein